jgi:hypothetical protein
MKHSTSFSLGGAAAAVAGTIRKLDLVLEAIEQMFESTAVIVQNEPPGRGFLVASLRRLQGHGEDLKRKSRVHDERTPNLWVAALSVKACAPSWRNRLNRG